MKKNKYTKFMAAVLLTGAPMLWSACTDDWNEHYDIIPGGMAEQASLLEKIQSDPELANFYKVIRGIDAVETLSSPQQLTVFAPKSLTEEQADSIIAVYNEDKEAGLKQKDNRAIKQFLQNHVALYSLPVSSVTDTTIHTLNKKRMELKASSTTQGTLSGNPFDTMKICNNGILYKMQDMQTFFPNIREYMELNGMDSVITFLKQYDKYTLDEQASVEGGIIDGNVIYLDSVTNITNQIQSGYGFINREDSNYLFIAPTNEVWKAEYETNKNYFVYDNTVNMRDSLQLFNTRMLTYGSRTFNMSKTSKHNQHATDSLTTTRYNLYQLHYPRTQVFYNPEETILNGLQEVECSNGKLYVDNKGTINPAKTFFTRDDIQATNSSMFEVPQSNGLPTMDVDFADHNVSAWDSVIVEIIESPDGLTFDTVWSYEPNLEKIKRTYHYAQFKAKTPSNQTVVTYTLPNIYSNVYYNMYIVTAPGRGTDTNLQDSLSSYFTVECTTRNLQGGDLKYGNDAKGNITTNTYMLNPVKYDANSPITGFADMSKQSNFDRAYASNSTKVDTILISMAKVFPTCSRGLDKGNVTLKFTSFGPAATKLKEKIYTRTLRFNEFILVPFKTKEEAEAAAFDLDAINDDLLMYKEANDKSYSTLE